MKFVFFVLFLILNFHFSIWAAPSCNEFLSEEDTETSSQPREILFVSSLDLNSIKQYMNQARRAFSAGKYIETLDYLRPILQYNKNDIRALHLYARVLLVQGNLEKAYKTQAKALKILGEYSEKDFVTFAQILLYKKEFSLAEKYLNAVLERNPKNTFALGMLSQIYLNTQRVAEAGELITRKGEIDPDDIIYRLLMFEYFYKKERFREALDMANEIIRRHKPKSKQKLVPRSYRKGLALRAKVLAKMNFDLERAWQDIEKYDSYNQFVSNWVYVLKAEIQFKMGRADKSRALLLELVKKLKGHDPLVIAGLIHLEKQGMEDTNHGETIQDPLIQAMLKGLSPTELVEVKKLSENFDWDYLSSSEDKNEISIFNNFWFGMDQMAVDSQTRLSTF